MLMLMPHTYPYIPLAIPLIASIPLPNTPTSTPPYTNTPPNPPFINTLSLYLYRRISIYLKLSALRS